MVQFFLALARRARYGWNHNLGLRVSVSLSLTLVLVMGLLSGALIFQQHRALRQAAESHARSIARTFSAIGSAAVIENLYRLQESMQLYMQTDFIVEIDIVDPDNMVVASKHPSHIGTLLESPEWLQATKSRQEYAEEFSHPDGHRTILLVEPLYDRGEITAWVRLLISLDDLNREAALTFWQVLAVTVGIMALGLSAIQSVLRKVSSALHDVVEILQPAQLTDPNAGLVAMSSLAKPRGQFERLVATATAAAKSMGEQAKALQDLAQSLEEKVVARTSQLEEARSQAVYALERLRDSESRLRSVVDTAADAILVTDEQWRIESANPAACALFGYAMTELCGKTIHDLLLRPISDSEEGSDAQDRRAYSPMDHKYAVGRRRDSTAFESEVSVSTMTLDGLPHHTVIVRDVTERHFMEAARRRTANRLQRLAEERAHLYRDLHDSLLQSLSAVNIGLETSNLLLAQAPDRAPRQLEWTTAHLQRVIREARDFVARLEPHTIHKDSLLRAFQSLVRPDTTWPCPPFQIDVDPEVASRLSVEQEVHLLSIVREAVSNTVRHAHARSGRIRLGLWEGSIRLEIADDGIGWVPPYGEQRGTGLSTMASHAQALHGHLSVESSPGEGTRIVLLIPRAPTSCIEGEAAHADR